MMATRLIALFSPQVSQLLILDLQKSHIETLFRSIQSKIRVSEISKSHLLWMFVFLIVKNEVDCANRRIKLEKLFSRHLEKYSTPSTHSTQVNIIQPHKNFHADEIPEKQGKSRAPAADKTQLFYFTGTSQPPTAKFLAEEELKKKSTGLTSATIPRRARAHIPARLP